MATHLQELLQSVCWKSEWNYAVFWKLNLHTPMVLTWEDAYYSSNLKHDASESIKRSSVALQSLPNGQCAHDPLRVAMENISYHVYSLGEGIVGQVAVTRKHQWIFSRDYMISDEWQEQFTAGVKTIVVVAVFPHGVVQLGSLNEVKEDLKLLTHIRDLFSSLQDPVAYHVRNPIQQNIPNVSDISASFFRPDALRDYVLDIDSAMNNPYGILLPGVHPSQPIILNEESQIPEAMDDHLTSSFMFSGGSELHEALGPYFINPHCDFSRGRENLEDSLPSHMPEVTGDSLLTSDSTSDNLLEAIVANFCRKNVTVKTGVSFSTSESMLTTEKMPGPSSLPEENMKNCLNSLDSCSIRSSTGACKDTPVRSVETGKPNKRRVRPSEIPRPRPRDRQLKQDRFKELRELVPNASKCSIDLLLERTIKHMVFMQNVTKHADKLSNCTKPKSCSKESGVLGSGYEQGSSWAVEVGGQMKICPILVENINVNGQMLIEILCEDCDNFLEIAQAIRNLGLTILKGITDNQGDKTWMRFIVEGESNKRLHRMDVLWSLVQFLESKATT